MSNPEPKILHYPPVFISAVTRELRSARLLAKKALEESHYHPVEQGILPPDYRDLIDMLRERIKTCEAVVHIAGQCYGAEPALRPHDAPRRSYTQLEYDIAVELGKPVYVFLTDDKFPTDDHEAEPPPLRALQAAHLQHLTSTGKVYKCVDSPTELDQKIRSIKLKEELLGEELHTVGENLAVTGGRLGRLLVLVAALSVATLAAVGYLGWGQHDARRVAQIEREFADRFLQQLLTNKEITADEARQRALKELPAVVKLPVAEIQSLIDRKLGPRATAVERARTALVNGKYDEVLDIEVQQKQQGREMAMLAGTAALAKFLQSPKPEWHSRALAAFQRAMALADPKSATEAEAWTDAALSAASVLRDLARYNQAETLLRECQRSLASNGSSNSPKATAVLSHLSLVLKATNRVVEAEALMRRTLAIDERCYDPSDPNVAAHLNNLAQLLQATNRMAEAEPPMRTALAIAERSYGHQHEVASYLNNLAQLLQATNRMAEAEPLMRRALAINERSLGNDHPDVAVNLNNLGGLLQATNRMANAEALYRQALAICERSYGPDHPSVATDLNNLAGLLEATNRVTQAEPLVRRALAIDEHSYGPDHPAVATHLNNLAAFLRDTNRVIEAEPLMRRALAIDEGSQGPEHPKVARDLDSLAALLEATNRTGVAEPLTRRALAIDELSYGPDHPNVAIRLNNFAQLLQATNRMAEAEPLLRRALATDERSYGPDHPNVARDLNNLAWILKSSNRLAEAEPLLARVVRIFSRFQRLTGHEHPHYRDSTENYRQVLSDLRLAEPEIQARVKATSNGTDTLSPSVPKVERLLGPAKPTKEVFEALDKQYHAQHKPPIWFLPLKDPIAPHLDQLLGATKTVNEVLETLDRQYHDQGKPAIWFLPLNEPITPHLDELLGKPSK